MRIGERIKESRSKEGLTQKELSIKSGVSQQMISKLESGKSDKTNDIHYLALALNCDPTWLATGKASDSISSERTKLRIVDTDSDSVNIDQYHDVHGDRS